MSLFRLLFLTCFVSTAGLSQTVQSKPSKPAAEPPTLLIALSPVENVSLPVPDKNWPAIPKQCGPDGTPYLWLLGGPEGMEIAGFRQSGILTFPLSQITDITNPSLGSFYVNESGVFALVSDLENSRTEQITDTDPDTGKEQKRSRRTGDTRYYIARFANDGSYKGAMKLDVPRFKPVQIAAFTSGAYLVAGLYDQNTPQLLLLDAGGGIVKFIELSGDVKENSKAAREAFAPWDLQTDINAITMFANFHAYGDNILFVRAMVNTAVFEIRDSGEVRAVKIRCPKGYRIGDVIPSERNWLVRLERATSGGPFGEATEALYEVDSEKGELVRRYEMANGSAPTGAMDSSMSCWHQGEFTAIRHEKGKVVLFSGMAESQK